MFYNKIGHDAEVAPLCPKCGADMIKRTAKRGSNKGQQFYGCSNYPKMQGSIRKMKSLIYMGNTILSDATIKFKEKTDM